MLCLALCACSGNPGGNGDKTPDKTPEELAETLLDGISFGDTLTEAPFDTGCTLYRLEAEGLSGVFYMGTGASAEELTILQAEDETRAEEVETAAKEHLDYQKDSYRDYIPAEMEKLDRAVVLRQGKMVIYCVSADKKAADQISAAFGE